MLFKECHLIGPIFKLLILWGHSHSNHDIPFPGLVESGHITMQNEFILLP